MLLSSFSRALALATCLAPLAAMPCAATGPTKFVIRPITINGNTDFNATSINAAGTIVGTLYDNAASTQTAVEISNGTATALRNPGGSFGPFFPRVVDDAGDVLGYASNTGLGLTDMFLLQAGNFNSAYQAALVEPSDASGVPPLPLGLATNLKVSFDTIYSISGPIGTSYGRPPDYRSVPSQNRYTQVNSINKSGMVAGTAFSLNGISAVYTGKGKTFTTITPPNAKSVIGGYINDANTVAGSYADNANTWHGFTYTGGTVTTFDMPEANNRVTVTGINRSGRVVGVYTDSTGKQQHGFLWNGTTAYSFGKYRAANTVILAIGNKGGIVVSDQNDASTDSYRSESVICRGQGC